MFVNASYCQKEIVTLGLARSYRPVKSNILFQETVPPTLENSIDTQSLPWNHSCLGYQILSEQPPLEWTKMATNPTMPTEFSFRFVSSYKTESTKIFQGLKATKAQRKSDSVDCPFAPMCGHELTVTNGIVLQNLRKFGLHFRKLIPQGC